MFGPKDHQSLLAQGLTWNTGLLFVYDLSPALIRFGFMILLRSGLLYDVFMCVMICIFRGFVCCFYGLYALVAIKHPGIPCFFNDFQQWLWFQGFWPSPWPCFGKATKIKNWFRSVLPVIALPGSGNGSRVGKVLTGGD